MSITPQQAFEAVKVLWPKTDHIRKACANTWDARTSSGEFVAGANFGTIDWGDLTQYPPPEPRWRKARKGDEGKKCRYSDSGNTWLNGGFLIACVDGLYFIKKYKNIAYGYNFCEVEDV